ncbi:MAG TPA: heat-inducible transcriptional repressor HrcA [Bryobacteraceae bacterium]|nr:heat-inducible transcriptional repressor HrcA [Bryobacteraceae bacterium]
MRKQPGLTDRNVAILHSIVQTYIETGEPVASRMVARRLREHLSPASVRNIMADLYEEGFLSQPHTSAGRVPTEKAFRSYVKTLASRKLSGGEIHRLRDELGRADSMQERVERSSLMLMEMTRSLGIAAAIPTSSQTLDQVDLLTLADRRVLMVVVTRDHMIRNRVVTLSAAMSQDELHSIRNYLNRNFSGWVLSDIRSELEGRLQHESALYDAMLKQLQVLYTNGLLDIDLDPEIHIEGASNLLGLDLHLTREKMRELFRALEQKKKILLLLDRFLEHPQGEVAVQVGLAEAHPSMGELSLIGVTITLPNGMSGKMAVLGPMRMNYERVISAVLHVGQAFQDI